MSRLRHWIYVCILIGIWICIGVVAAAAATTPVTSAITASATVNVGTSVGGKVGTLSPIASGARPTAITLTVDGVLYGCETGRHAIVQWVPTNVTAGVGNVTMAKRYLAGNGVAGYRDGSGEVALFDSPSGIAALRVNSTIVKLYVSDSNNHRIRIITVIYSASMTFSPASVFVATLAGDGIAGYRNGTLDSARFAFPQGLTIARHGLFIADTFNHVIRFIYLTTDSTNFGNNYSVTAAQTLQQTITLIGNGFSGNVDGLLTNGRLSYPSSVTTNTDSATAFNDMSTMLYATHQHAVVMMDNTRIVTIAGGSTSGYLDGIGVTSRFSTPSGVAVDSDGNVYIADTGNNVIRFMTGADPTLFPLLTGLSITTLLGDPSTRGFTNGNSVTSRFSSPSSIALNAVPTPNNAFYISDMGNNAIRTSTAACRSVCQNGGTCTSLNFCDCPANYLTDDCSEPLCLPACPTAIDGTVCLAPYSCGCPIGYGGTNCAQAICTSYCNTTFGSCVAPDVCHCQSGWTGDHCDEPICNTVHCVNGYCYSNNLCHCDLGWQGANCTIPVCVCQNGGACIAPDVCDCQGTGYIDATCSTPACDPECENDGVCASPNTCVCDPSSWSGPLCTDPICVGGCNNGYCSAPANCSCNDGWSGPQCDIAICDQTCQNGGTCVSPNTCYCSSGWNGPDCSQPICNTPVCAFHQTCDAPNTCVEICNPVCVQGTCDITTAICGCDPGWNGTACDSAVCQDKCLNGGSCIAPDTCQCTGFYEGIVCEVPKCPNINCLHGGQCSAPDTCSCLPGWMSAPDCSIPMCSNSICNATTNNCTVINGCLNDGNCVGLPSNIVQCNCTSNWTGASCETPVCTPRCLNGGTCIAPNVCQCTSDYMGGTCSDAITADSGFWGNNQDIVVYSAIIVAFLVILSIGWQIRKRYDNKFKSRYEYQSEFDVRKAFQREKRRKEKEKQRLAVIAEAKKAGVPLESLGKHLGRLRKSHSRSKLHSKHSSKHHRRPMSAMSGLSRNTPIQQPHYSNSLGGSFINGRKEYILDSMNGSAGQDGQSVYDAMVQDMIPPNLIEDGEDVPVYDARHLEAFQNQYLPQLGQFSYPYPADNDLNPEYMGGNAEADADADDEEDDDEREEEGDESGETSEAGTNGDDSASNNENEPEQDSLLRYNT